MKAFVICCNDAIEKVVLKGREEADAILRKMREEHSGLAIDGWPVSRHEEYAKAYYWHIHETEAV